MNSINIKKIRCIKNNFKIINYFNPFKINNIEKYATKLNIELVPINKGYKNISFLGFFENRICEIIYSENFTNDEIDHLNKIINITELVPLLLLVDKLFNIVKKIDYIKIEYPNDKWIPATQTKNYILDDPLIDYLKYNIINKSSSNTSNNKRKRSYSEPLSSFTEQIFKKGNEYEVKIISKIQSLYPNNFIKIGESYEAKNYSNYKKTLESIKNGIKIIYQPVLWNYTNKTYGCADLIIKSNFVSKIFPDFKDNEEDAYLVFDIKWSSLQLKADSDMLINSDLVKAYKGQLWIYTEALSEMQSKKVTKAYIIARNFYREKTYNKVKSVEYFTEFNKLGLINYEIEKEYIDKTKKSLEWIDEIRTNKRLKHDPPNDIRLYPNMKNTYDDNFKLVKKELAEKNKEITLLFNVGVNHRNNAVKNEITKYTDPRLNCDVLNITGKKKEIINSIIEINRSEEKIKYKQLSNFGNWKNAKVRFYLDIETINNTVYDLNHVRSNYIFMIGLGIVKNNEWSFKSFITKDITKNEEERILNDFENEIKKHDCNEEYPVFHWSNFENINLKPLINIPLNIKFFDMNKWFLEDEIFVKGALNFKLKSITKALYNNGLIDVKWDDSVADGMSAMDYAFRHYKKENTIPNVMDEILKYNEMDCMAMYKIHDLLNNEIIES